MQVISMVTPRPIAFISSQDEAGTVNVSPYSYFNVMSHDPIHITIGTNGGQCRREVRIACSTSDSKTKGLYVVTCCHRLLCVRRSRALYSPAGKWPQRLTAEHLGYGVCRM
jgi:hypothetical protein